MSASVRRSQREIVRVATGNKFVRRRRKGTGSIRFDRTERRWVGYVTIGGKRHHFHGPRGVKSADAKLLVEEKMRPFVNASPRGVGITLGGIVERYLATHPIAATTREVQRYALRHLLGDAPGDRIRTTKRLGPDPIARVSIIALRPSDLHDYYARLPISQHTKRRLHSIIHAALAEAERLELIVRNPAAKLKRPAVSKARKVIWTPDQLATFLRTARTHRLYPLFLLALTTTMGNAELFGLQWADVDLDLGTIDVRHNFVTSGRLRGLLKDPKTASRRRSIALPPVTVQAMRAHRAGTNGTAFVFTDDRGRPFIGDTFRRCVWHPLIGQAQVPRVTPYAMRHMAKAIMDLMGVSLERQSARMGHSTIGTTVGVYGHLYGDADKAVAEQIDAFFSTLA